MKKTENGFSLIELLVVVLIIGILTAIALPQYQLTVGKARFNSMFPVALAVKQAQELYYLAHDKYASTFEELQNYPLGEDWQIDTNEPQTITKNRARISLGSSYVIVSADYISMPNLTINYDHTSSPGKRNCYAYGTTTRTHRLCKAISGNDGTPACNQGSCRVYTF